MDPITTALAAGAAFVLKGMAGEAVKDAYQELKEVLAGKLTSLAVLEEDPGDEDFRKATEKELHKKGLADDPAALRKAGELAQAIEREAARRHESANIDISALRAARDVIIKRLGAAGGVRVKEVRSEQGSIDIQDVSAGQSEKN